MFSKPATASSIDWTAHLGHLTLVEPTGYEEAVPTSNGDKDAIRGTVTFLVGPDEAEVHEDALIFGMKLIGQLRSRLGEKVLGRLGQGVAKPGQNAPWLLLDATEDDIAKATTYVTGRDKPAVTSAKAPF